MHSGVLAFMRYLVGAFFYGALFVGGANAQNKAWLIDIRSSLLLKFHILIHGCESTRRYLWASIVLVSSLHGQPLPISSVVRLGIS